LGYLCVLFPPFLPVSYVGRDSKERKPGLSARLQSFHALEGSVVAVEIVVQLPSQQFRGWPRCISSTALESERVEPCDHKPATIYAHGPHRHKLERRQSDLARRPTHLRGTRRHVRHIGLRISVHQHPRADCWSDSFLLEISGRNLREEFRTSRLVVGSIPPNPRMPHAKVTVGRDGLGGRRSKCAQWSVSAVVAIVTRQNRSPMTRHAGPMFFGSCVVIRSGMAAQRSCS
jgi:hypothetical protein